MNGYRLSGDMIHLFAFVLLLFKLWVYKSAAGISGKTQILLALVFTTRYFDLFTTYISVYNADLKILYICLSYCTVLSIYTMFRKTYEGDLDTLRIEFLIAAAMVLALIVNYAFTAVEVFWAFSEYLEAVAAWPQFFMIKKTKKVKTVVLVYLSSLGLYRLLYMANWIYKYYTQNHYDLISIVSGSVQVAPFLLFWVLCVTKVVAITSEKTSWFGKNLTQSDKNGIFTIQVPGGFDVKDTKVSLLNNSEETEEQEGEFTIVRPWPKQDIPTVHEV